MPDSLKKNFEVHITIDPMPHEEREMWGKLLAEHGYRIAKLHKANNETHEMDGFITGYGEGYSETFNRMAFVVRLLTKGNVKVRRAKIELQVFDTKYSDILPGVNGVDDQVS